MTNGRQSALFAEAEPVHDPGGKVRIRLAPDVTPGAEFSPCGRYRYKLWRTWSDRKPLLMCLMNPSVADGERFDDPTVAKCGRFARSWHYGGPMVGNACAYRSTSPVGLLQVDDPVGPRNHAAILEMAETAGTVMIAHGNLPGKLQVHAEEMVRILQNAGHTLWVLGFSKHGLPNHPLYLPKNTKPILWSRETKSEGNAQ